MKELKKLKLAKKTIQALGSSAMSELKGGDILHTKIGGKCLATPTPSASGFMSCA